MVYIRETRVYKPWLLDLLCIWLAIVDHCHLHLPTPSEPGLVICTNSSIEVMEYSAVRKLGWGVEVIFFRIVISRRLQTPFGFEIGVFWKKN